MRRALAIVLLCIVSHQLLMKLGIIAWYEYNKAYIAQTLCENRNKPQLKCCGKCYLRKQLAKADADNHAGKPLAVRLSRGEISPFILPEAIRIAALFNEQDASLYRYRAPFAEEITRSVFHPPG